MNESEKIEQIIGVAKGIFYPFVTDPEERMAIVYAICNGLDPNVDEIELETCKSLNSDYGSLKKMDITDEEVEKHYKHFNAQFHE